MQCNSKTLYQMFKLLPLALTHALSINRHRSVVCSMTVCWILYQVSIRHRLNSSTSRSGCW